MGTPSIKGGTESMRMALLTFSLVGLQCVLSPFRRPFPFPTQNQSSSRVELDWERWEHQQRRLQPGMPTIATVNCVSFPSSKGSLGVLK